MIQGGESVETVATDGSFTGFRKFDAGAKFSLVPVSAGAKFPVHVYPNGRNADPIVVTSAAWQGGTPFENLRIDVTPGGGQAGDTWRIQWADAESGEGQRPRTDDKGNLTVTTSPQVILMRKTFYSGALEDGTYAFPGFSAPTDGDGFIDVRAYRAVKWAVWLQEPLATATGTPTMSVKLEVAEEDLSGEAGGYYSPGMTVTVAPTDSNIAALPGDFNQSRFSQVLVGEVDDRDTTNDRRYASRVGWVRPLLVVAGAGTGVEMDGDGVAVLIGYP